MKHAVLTSGFVLGLGTSLVASLAGGCVSEEAPELGTAVAASEVVTEPPAMHLWCNGCFDRHVVGEPVRLVTSFHGYCKTPPFNLEYRCRPQPYSLTVECVGGACDADPAGGSEDGFDRYTDVTPLEAGRSSIHARMNTTGFESYIPDELRVTCTSGQGQTDPCVDGPNPPPVRLRATVLAGGAPLVPRGRFEFTSDRPGTQSGNAGDDWYLSAPGVHHVSASYGPVSIDRVIEIAAPPPPPPPPVGHDVGRVVLRGADQLAP